MMFSSATAKVPKLDYPISVKENFRRAAERNDPLWVPHSMPAMLPVGQFALGAAPPPGRRPPPLETRGHGCIGREALTRVVRHPALRDLPFCLETPNELPGYQAEIALMRQAAE